MTSSRLQTFYRKYKFKPMDQWTKEKNYNLYSIK